MSALADIEQAALDLIDEFSTDHTVNGANVTCYLGRERREFDEVQMVHHVARTYAGKNSLVTAPVPNVAIIVDGVTYTVHDVATYTSSFKAKLHRRQ